MFSFHSHEEVVRYYGDASEMATGEGCEGYSSSPISRKGYRPNNFCCFLKRPFTALFPQIYAAVIFFKKHYDYTVEQHNIITLLFR